MRSRLAPLPLFAMALLAGCGSGAADNDSATANSAASAEALAAQPVREEHRNLALTQAWLTGRWQTGDGNCGAGDTFFTLNPDGRYTFMQEQGRWTLEGERLTIEVTEAGDAGVPAGQRNSNQVRVIGPNEAEFRPEGGGDPIRVFRCHDQG